MKVSINHIRFYQKRYSWSDEPMPDGVAALAAKVGAQLGAIEEIIDIGTKYNDVLIVRVVSCEQHPNADRLHVCTVDDGGRAQHVVRNEQGHIQVVCGAPNVRVGMRAAWLPPGATVPSTYGKEPFVLEARELRGVVSNGMMASAKELSLGDDHDGILEIDEDISPGTSFVDAYNLRGDYVLDLENKMFTHRPDCFGMIGVAREIAGIQGQAFKSPEWYSSNPGFPDIEAEALPLEVSNELPELVPRFTAIALRDVQVRPSPVWLRVMLSKLGVRSINNIVDYTNYFMLLTGQPLHAYDYDKVKALDSGADHATLCVRRPHDGETITLLNGKTVTPRPETIMIATRDKVVGIGGIMGGGETEVDEHTTNIIIECATFDMYSIRKTSMALGLFTDAVTRFTKGQSPLQNRAVLAKIVDEIRQFAGGKVASAVIDDNQLTDVVQETGNIHAPLVVSAPFINARLGLQLTVADMQTLLTNVEFGVRTEGDDLLVTAPFWRTDIVIQEDIVEEVGRLYGYDKLPLDLPRRDLTPAVKNDLLELKRSVRENLVKMGANEVLTYSFVHGNLLDKTGQDRAQAFQLANALSPDLQYYRLSLLPSLLERVHPNVKAGYESFALFELGKAHDKQRMAYDEPSVPGEANSLAFVVAAAGKQLPAGAPYYQARRSMDQLLWAFGADQLVMLEPLAGADLYNNQWAIQATAPFDPARSAVLRDRQGLLWGVVGELRPAVRRALKLPEYCAAFELDPILFLQTEEHIRQRYLQLPRFPKVEQDICLKVPAELPYEELFRFVADRLHQLRPANSLSGVQPLDIYQRPDDPAHKQITFRMTLASYERTLTDTEVAAMLDAIAVAAKVKLRAERV